MSQDTGRQGLSPRLTKFFYGGDYNPEQWPEEVWLEDMRLMKEARVTIVSVGIFSWAKLEPQPGQFEWGWLDRIMDLLAENGIRADLATATASPPPWLAKQHPESLPVNHAGQTLWPGGRQQYCPSSPAYRQAAANLVRQIASRYKDHPALAMWHINNEYGCHVPECYCDISAADFRQWLKHRYGTLENLNAAWGTAFWSQQYGDWEEIWPPRLAPTFANPTQQLDWKRFSSDAILACFELEKSVLREITPEVPVTTNFMNFFKPLDYWKWAASQDVVSNDSYPDPFDPNAIVGAAMSYDLMRSLGQGRPWLLMEQTPSQVNWRAQNALKRPGQMRLWSFQAVARGADGIMFFQWRAAKAGAEKFHGAMVPHVGTENSRVWREVTRLGRDLDSLDEVLSSRVTAPVAILLDWDSWWALELDSKPSTHIKLMEQLESYYRPLWRRNVAVQFIHPSADLTPYRVVLAPNLYLTRDEDRLGERLEKFVQAGGSLIMSFFSGITDQNEHIRLGGYPAPFRRVLGLRVEELQPIKTGQTNRLELTTRVGNLSGSYECHQWADLLDLEGASALATYTEDFYAGRPAITRHEFGSGKAYYLGTQPAEQLIETLLEQACHEAEVEWLPTAPDNIEVIYREKAGTRYLFILNHNPASVEYNLPVSAPAQDLLTGQTVSGKVRLEPYGVTILKQD